MYAIKRELKLNNKEKSFFAGCAGNSWFVYNYGLSVAQSHLGNSRFALAVTQNPQMLSRKPLQIWPKKQTEYLWTNKYSSPIYQNAFGKVKKAFSRWREPKIKAELPRFKKKKHHCSFTVDSSNGKVLVTEGKKIKIPTLGTFRQKEDIPNKLCFSDLYYIYSCT